MNEVTVHGHVVDSNGIPLDYLDDDKSPIPDATGESFRVGRLNAINEAGRNVVSFKCPRMYAAIGIRVLEVDPNLVTIIKDSAFEKAGLLTVHNSGGGRQLCAWISAVDHIIRQAGGDLKRDPKRMSADITALAVQFRASVCGFASNPLLLAELFEKVVFDCETQGTIQSLDELKRYSKAIVNAAVQVSREVSSLSEQILIKNVEADPLFSFCNCVEVEARIQEEVNGIIAKALGAGNIAGLGTNLKMSCFTEGNEAGNNGLLLAHGLLSKLKITNLCVLSTIKSGFNIAGGASRSAINENIGSAFIVHNGNHHWECLDLEKIDCKLLLCETQVVEDSAEASIMWKLTQHMNVVTEVASSDHEDSDLEDGKKAADTTEKIWSQQSVQFQSQWKSFWEENGARLNKLHSTRHKIEVALKETYQSRLFWVH